MQSLDDWQKLSAGISFIDTAMIDGRKVAAEQTLDCIDPASGRLLARVADCGATEVDRAVDSARRAFASGLWAHQAPRDRQKVLLRLAELIEVHRAELALLDTLSVGKPIADSWNVDVPGAAGVFRWYAEHLDKAYGQIAPTANDVLATITREPVGVVAAVVPWNFPLDIAAWKLAPALAAGNSVVLKPAEQSPFSALFLAELALEAGLPPGVFNVTPGQGRRAGRALGLHMDVDSLVFTGSTRVGRHFMGYSAQSNLKQVWLECGGKSANIVFSNCHDLADAARKAAAGIFYNQGEVCSANSRLLVQDDIHDTFLEHLLAHAGRWLPGPPLDPESVAGAIVDRRQTERIMTYIEGAPSQGAHRLCGGRRLTIGGSDNYVEPTIFTEVCPDSRLAREEVFGPVLAVTRFADEEDALRLANDSVYGLAASVWTDDLSQAHRVAGRLDAGTVSVNTIDALDPTVPFGGNRQSGFGRDLSVHAIDKYTRLKTTWYQFR